MIEKLREMGVTSTMAYMAGIASIGLSATTWLVSKKTKTETTTNRGEDRALFVGQWAPTFFILGTALRLDEQMDKKR
ncbi:hypothetical protein [Allosalinactinospora lopnorensis]|uniref:hypothetical protein n=1 Tax=Allosalinactinospora lopnorensis TaxID=1352348 RepID=UPI000623E2D3|nr:hypothetical protein [Allosalinactinospora lopnorensis]